MSETLDIISEVQSLTETFKKQQAELIEKFKPNFQKLFVPFLESHPEIKAISFTAYTPYFNDGDTCEYGVGELTLIPADEELEPDWGKGFEECELQYSRSLNPEQREMLQAAFNDLKPTTEAFSQIPEEIMMGIVGDHAEVTITLDGMEIEEYEHD